MGTFHFLNNPFKPFIFSNWLMLDNLPDITTLGTSLSNFKHHDQCQTPASGSHPNIFWHLCFNNLLFCHHLEFLNLLFSSIWSYSVRFDLFELIWGFLKLLSKLLFIIPFALSYTQVGVISSTQKWLDSVLYALLLAFKGKNLVQPKSVTNTYSHLLPLSHTLN